MRKVDNILLLVQLHTLPFTHRSGTMSGFAVVWFTNDDQTSSVPSTWMIGTNQCYWPPGRDTTRHIKSQAEPTNGWQIYDAEVVMDIDSGVKYGEAYQKYINFTNSLTQEEETGRLYLRKHPLKRLPGSTLPVKDLNANFVKSKLFCNILYM